MRSRIIARAGRWWRHCAALATRRSWRYVIRDRGFPWLPPWGASKWNVIATVWWVQENVRWWPPSHPSPLWKQASLTLTPWLDRGQKSSADHLLAQHPYLLPHHLLHRPRLRRGD